MTQTRSQEYSKDASCNLSCILWEGSTCVRTPSRRLSRKKLISTSVNTSGRAPTSPKTWPTSLSALVRVGSTCIQSNSSLSLLSYIPQTQTRRFGLQELKWWSGSTKWYLYAQRYRATEPKLAPGIWVTHKKFSTFSTLQQEWRWETHGGSNTNEPARDCVLQRVELCK